MFQEKVEKLETEKTIPPTLPISVSIGWICVFASYPVLCALVPTEIAFPLCAAFLAPFTFAKQALRVSVEGIHDP
jgi:hypothetical protein